MEIISEYRSKRLFPMILSLKNTRKKRRNVPFADAAKLFPRPFMKSMRKWKSYKNRGNLR